MCNILFITADTQPEEESICKKLGRELLNKIKEKNINCCYEELDLYNSNIPEMNSLYVTNEVSLVEGEKYNSLSPQAKASVDRIDELSNQFLQGDIYIIAAPMWSLSFPSKLKQYIDCIVLGNKFLLFDGSNKPKPLLNDKERTIVYIQTSGGDYPFFMEHKINYGVNYCHDLFKGLGVKHFEEILVEGTIQYKDNPDKYLDKAHKEIEKVAKKLLTLEAMQ